jgi:ribosomal protein S27AE
MKTHPEIIKCPECGAVQMAEVVESMPWNIYVHDCIKCGYTIMESDWEEVK